MCECAAHRDTATTSAQRLATLGTLARAAAARGAQFLVFPEMALGFDLQVYFSDELKALASEAQTYFVMGYVVDDTHGSWNEATVLAPIGEFLGVYGRDVLLRSLGTIHAAAGCFNRAASMMDATPHRSALGRGLEQCHP